MPIRAIHILLAVVLLLSTLPAQYSQAAEREIVWIEMVSFLVGGTPDDQIINAVNERGVAFEASSYELEPLRNLGASDRVMQALWSALRVNEDKPDPDAVAKGVERAEPLLREALLSKRDNAALHYALAIALSMRGDRKGYVQELREAIRLNPRDPYAHADLAELQSDRGTNKAAIPEIRRALQLKPDFKGAYNLLAQILEWMRDNREFVSRYGLGKPELYIALGDHLSSKGDMEGALAEYLRLVEADSERGVSRLRRVGDAYMSRGEFDRAIAAYRFALEHAQHDAPSHYALGLALLKTGNKAAALEAIRKAQELDPDNPDYAAKSQELTR